MQCPACEERLSRVDYRGVAVGRCEACGGSWLTGSGFAGVTTMDASDVSPVEAAKLKVLAEYKVDKNVTPTEHPCPKCGRTLKGRNYANIAGFRIEQCPRGCGVWVREGDLDKIRILRSLGHGEEVKTKARAPAARKKPAAPAPGEPPSPPAKTPAEPPKRKRTPPKSASLPGTRREPAARKPGLLSRLIARLLGRT